MQTRCDQPVVKLSHRLHMMKFCHAVALSRCLPQRALTLLAFQKLPTLQELLSDARSQVPNRMVTPTTQVDLRRRSAFQGVV